MQTVESKKETLGGGGGGVFTAGLWLLQVWPPNTIGVVKESADDWTFETMNNVVQTTNMSTGAYSVNGTYILLWRYPSPTPKSETFPAVKLCKSSVPVLSLSTGACKTSELAEDLGLTVMKDRKWFVQGACAPTGEGIYEAMAEMARLSKDFQKSKRWFGYVQPFNNPTGRLSKHWSF